MTLTTAAATPAGSTPTASPVDLTKPVSPGPPSPTRPRRETTRLRALDGLRLLAALGVCLFHYTAKPDMATNWGAAPSTLFPHLSVVGAYGNLGVQLFFVISGFVICMSTWGRTLGDFFRSRVARLYPAYWAAIVIITVASCILPTVVRPLRLDVFLLNLTMLQQPMGADRVIGVDWTLWVEVKFYLLFGLFVVRKGVTYRRVVAFSLLWLLAGVLARVAHTPLLDEIVFRDHAPFFVAGLMFYLIHRYGHDLLLWGIVVASFLFAQRYVVTALWSAGPTSLDRSLVVLVLVTALCYVLVAAVALGWLSWASWRWLTVAGALTYPFYLLHEHLGWFWIRVLSRGLHLPAPVVLVVTVTSMLLLAYAVHRLVERPLGPLIKRTLVHQAGRRPLG